MNKLLKGRFLNINQLNKINFKKLGKNVLIDSNVIIPEPENVIIGNNVRIDTNCILSASKKGNIIIKNNVHIAPFNLIYCSNNHIIKLENHSGLAAGCKLYGKTELYDGTFLMNPTHNLEDIKIIEGNIILKQFATLGCNSVLFPNSIIPEGTVFGSNSLFNGKKKLNKWCIYTGSPIRFYKKRKQNCILLSEKYI